MKSNLFSYIIEMLQRTEYRGSSEEIQTALGKYHLPDNFKDALIKIKRLWQ
jgi:hypothetical protein